MGSSPQEWMSVFNKMADPGTGVFDIAAMVKAGKKAGVKHFYLERDLTPTPIKTLEHSIEYFRLLK